MIGLDRRKVLIGMVAGACSALVGGNGWALGETAPAVEGSPGNPHSVRGAVYTIVTADIAASLAFYRDAYGYDHVVQGKLGQRLPTPGAGEAGRRFAVLNFKNTTDHDAIGFGGIRRPRVQPPGRNADDGAWKQNRVQSTITPITIKQV